MSERGWWRLASLALTALLAGGCSKYLLLAPSGATITLFPTTTPTTPVVLSLGGSLTITANVTNVTTDPKTPTVTNKMPVQDGTVVTFTTNLGHFVSSQVETVGGQAVATLVADTTPGAAKVFAFSNGASASIDVTVGLAAETVSVSAAPSSLPVTGGTSVIAARVQDASGNGVAFATVTFKSDGVGNSVSPATAITDATGKAQTTLTAVGPTTVTATTTLGKFGTVSVAVAGHSVVRIDPIPSSGTVAFGSPITFTLTPTAGTGTTITDVKIDFGDGTTKSLGPITSATTIAHLYARSGSFVVAATVTDSTGAITTVFSTVVVTAAAPPTLTLEIPNPVAVSTPATFRLTASTGTGTTVTDVSIDFGDGTVRSLGPISSSNVAHLYATSGTFTVTATVTASNGATAPAVSSYVVIPLVASLTAPSSGSVNSVLSFTATASTGASIDHYVWDFGDGASATSSGPTTTHAYATAGTFTVTVRVVPTVGAAVTTTAQVHVT
jgi:PKD repeat protein